MSKVSVIIRTLNEQMYLAELLQSVCSQAMNGIEVEVVIVDSGSTDSTLEIAKNYGARVTTINRKDFTFGRSLNIGCEFSLGDVLVFISGHCVPTDEHWLFKLVSPVFDGKVDYSYGRQIGRDTTKFSERQVFRKYFPEKSDCPQIGYFVNNANAAILRDTWSRLRFDEQLTGLEDMALAKRLVDSGKKVGYVSDAVVYHIHDESWRKVKVRYEREAIALQHIMPEVHLKLSDLLRYWLSAVLNDVSVAVNERSLFREFFGILAFRTMQYWGGYIGNHEHRKLSAARKEAYFYPK